MMLTAADYQTWRSHEARYGGAHARKRPSVSESVSL